MKTLGELCDEVVAAANAYHELTDDRRWNALHRAIERYNEYKRNHARACINCRRSASCGYAVIDGGCNRFECNAGGAE